MSSSSSNIHTRNYDVYRGTIQYWANPDLEQKIVEYLSRVHVTTTARIAAGVDGQPQKVWNALQKLQVERRVGISSSNFLDDVWYIRGVDTKVLLKLHPLEQRYEHGRTFTPLSRFVLCSTDDLSQHKQILDTWSVSGKGTHSIIRDLATAIEHKWTDQACIDAIITAVGEDNVRKNCVFT